MIEEHNAVRLAAGQTELAPQRWHDLRHQAASFQFAMGARETEVEAFLRHAPGSNVGRRYTHQLAKAKTDAADRLNRLFPVFERPIRGAGS